MLDCSNAQMLDCSNAQLFIIHYSLFIFHFSFALCLSSLFIIHYSLFIFHFSFALCLSSLFIIHFSFFIFHFSFALCLSSLFIRLLSAVCCLQSFYMGIPARKLAVGLRPILLVSLQGSDRPGSSSQARSARSVIP